MKSKALLEADEVRKFWDRVLDDTEDLTSGCWVWPTSSAKERYGRYALANGRGTVAAHRYAYETAVGRVPFGMELDHLCCNIACVNPKHLEVVTPNENKCRVARRRAVETRLAKYRLQRKAEEATWGELWKSSTI